VALSQKAHKRISRFIQKPMHFMNNRPKPANGAVLLACICMSSLLYACGAENEGKNSAEDWLKMPLRAESCATS
jgi:hypothetical protein